MTIFTIDPALPFLDALAEGLLSEAEGDPLALASMQVLLPTRRSCLALRDAFLRLSDGGALLLPRLVPLGDVDAEELEITDVAGTLALPPAIAGLHRQLLLARLIMQRDGMPPDQAAALGAELARLLDQLATDRVPFAALETLVPENYAEHWQRVLAFLGILGEHWPAILAEEGAVDPAERRNLTLAAQAQAWRDAPPETPVIAAGSTGSIPATAELLATIATLPQGRVVLPGLDRGLEEESWQALEPTHPQYGMKQLLAALGVERAAVRDWPTARVRPGAAGRTALLRAALNPLPLDLPPQPDIEQALAGVSLIACLNPQQEAGVIALLLREALERPGTTAALVTPDRDLARRVAAELARFGVAIDDSAGTPLDRTAPGTYLRLLLRMVEEKAAPAALLALLQHPLAAGGEAPAAFRSMVRRLDRQVLRGPRPQSGFDGLRRAIASARRISPEERQALAVWTERLMALLAPLMEQLARPSATLAELVEVHVGIAEALARTDSTAGAERLWAGEAGDAAAQFIADLGESAARFPALEPARYPGLFEALMQARVVRPRYGRHPRLAIWGPLEARLQRADRLILGGLNEGTWPADPAGDPWLSRPMRKALGLPSPERRIGQSAHDFVQAFAAPELILTRAQRVEGAPTVPSRWLQRLATLLRAVDLEAALEPRQPWLAWQHQLDRPGAVQPVRPPAPRPPVAARPRALWVTDIETWMRDPYALYARRILGLQRLDPIDADVGAAERGTFIHQALDRFVRACPDALPADALDRLLAFGREAFGPVLGQTAAWAFWWPRFERIARWVVGEEEQRRPALARILTEVKGGTSFDGPAGPFLLSGKADRLEQRRDGSIALIDYKTGSVPSPRDIAAGLAAQLPLEAVIAEQGGFPGLAAGTAVAALAHWRLSGGDPPGEVKEIAEVAARIAGARAGLARLIAEFDRPETPYRARPHPAHGLRFNDYAHLARIKEWAAEDGE